MARFEQYEVWEVQEGRWNFVASFTDFDTAYSISRNRKDRVRLLKVTYEGSQMLEQEIIAEVGATRIEP
ncbi:MAG TPA: hypothetical protein VN577_05280 [Terriglobales bacterium]|nr:hypothetical protein [Terriglobales bacterium]